MSVHPFSTSHISSKRNSFSWIVGSKILGWIQRGEWSDVLQFRWCTDEPPKRISHSLLVKLLSSLSHIEVPFLEKKKSQKKKSNLWSHVYKSTFINYIPKQLHLHLSITPIIATFLLCSSQNLVKTTWAQPRQTVLWIELSEQIPWSMPFLRIWFTIEACKPPSTFAAFPNNTINVIFWGCFYFQIHCFLPI